MAGLERLHPHLRHAIIHDLGWRALRPVQADTIDVILDGANTVVLAPTAGGKTEASIFPVLSRILSEDLSPVAALYICPIRALLNNQEDRIGGYAKMVGLEAFKWHGDVSASLKTRFRRQPAHLLLTTPESLEVMLISEKTDARALFAGLSMVVIDEVHAFAADDRGAHLMSLLERISRFCGRDLQRIGLSATVGNPEKLGCWLQGSSQRPFRLVDPPRPPAPRDLRIDLCDSIESAARGIGQMARGKKSLIFVESRSRAEQVAHALEGAGVDVFIHHSSVSRSDRALAEEQFTRGQNTAIVATSTMELGIDVGDLDLVLQVDAPSSVASFLQRTGRTGRRPGSRSNCTFFCLTPEYLLQAVALLRLASRGWIEPVCPPTRAMHVLAHQILALVLQEGGISRHRLFPWLRDAWPFASVTVMEIQTLLTTMLARDILYEGDGLLSLGKNGEELYGKRHFFDLYAVFTAPPVLRVLRGTEEIGFVQALFVMLHDEHEGPLCFRLSGRAWKVIHIDWARGILRVVTAERGHVPSWFGFPGALSVALCAEMRAVLVEPGPEAEWLSTIAYRELEALRESYAGVLDGDPLESTDDGVTWHTFAGGAVNRLLVTGLKQVTGYHWVSGNLSVKAKDIGMVAARAGLRELQALDWNVVARITAQNFMWGPISKFQPCLPQEAEEALLIDRLLDVEGVVRFMEAQSRWVAA